MSSEAALPQQELPLVGNAHMMDNQNEIDGEESKEQQLSEFDHVTDKTLEASTIAAPPQDNHTFSHLFPAHLYVKHRSTAGQEIDHNEDIMVTPADQAGEAQSSLRGVETTANVEKHELLLFDHESKVQIGPETTASSYDRVPVDQFGAAVLSKLGWQGSGHGIGRNKEKASQVIEYIPRQHRLGLGAQAISKEHLTQQAKGGVQVDKRKLTVTQSYEASSIGRNYKGIDEELVAKKAEVLELGSDVVITGGTHKGLLGKIVAIQKQKAAPREAAYGMQSKVIADGAIGAEKIDPEAYVSVELETSNSTVQVKRKRLDLQSSRDSQTQLSAEQAEESKKLQKRRSRSNSPSSKHNNPKNKSESSRDHHRSSAKPLKWVTEGIQVRVVSKKVFSGRLYNKVLPVSTVLDQYSFEVYSDEHNRHITELREKDVETVLPRSKDVEKEQGNRSVLIVRGNDKGVQGTVTSIDKKRDKVQVLVDFTELITVGQDDCSLKIAPK